MTGDAVVDGLEGCGKGIFEQVAVPGGRGDAVFHGEEGYGKAIVKNVAGTVSCTECVEIWRS